MNEKEEILIAALNEYDVLYLYETNHKYIDDYDRAFDAIFAAMDKYAELIKNKESGDNLY